MNAYNLAKTMLERDESLNPHFIMHLAYLAQVWNNVYIFHCMDLWVQSETQLQRDRVLSILVELASDGTYFGPKIDTKGRLG